MTQTKPSIRTTETYTESNFIRLHTAAWDAAAPVLRAVTIEHFHYRASNEAHAGGWRCETIVDREAMSAEDAVLIARSYARENGIPVIYECHSD